MVALALVGCAHLASRSEYVGSYRDQGDDGDRHHGTYWSTHLELRADGTWLEKTSTRSPYGTESERHDGRWRASRLGEAARITASAASTPPTPGSRPPPARP